MTEATTTLTRRLDYIALVDTADYKVIHAESGITLHDVQENGLSADLYYRFGFEKGFFGYAGSETTGENNGFHIVDDP